MQKSGESQVSIVIHIWHSSDSSDQDILAVSDSDSKSDHKLKLLLVGHKLKQQLPQVDASCQDSDKPTHPLTANTVQVSHLSLFTQVDSK